MSRQRIHTDNRKESRIGIAQKAGYISKRDLRRREILKAAAALFSEKSYHDVKMDEVAHAAGVGKGTVYLYFDSKENLYLEIIGSAFEELVALIEKEIAKAQAAPKKLAQMLEVIFRFFGEHKDVLRILSRDETHLIREHFELTEHWRRRGLDLYQEIIEKGIKEGSFKAVNAKITALIIYGLIRSVTFYYGETKRPEKVAEEVYSILAEGILTSQGITARNK